MEMNIKPLHICSYDKMYIISSHTLILLLSEALTFSQEMQFSVKQNHYFKSYKNSDVKFLK